MNLPKMIADRAFGVIDVAKVISEGYECHRAVDDPSVYYPPQFGGFGLARIKEEGMVDEDRLAAYDLKQVHFYWPNPTDRAECQSATLYGNPTNEERGAVEKLAVDSVRPLGEGAKWLFWRREPEWVSERDFEANTTTHRLQMRGSFVWKNTNG